MQVTTARMDEYAELVQRDTDQVLVLNEAMVSVMMVLVLQDLLAEV